MLKIRRPLGRLIFNMGITIPCKTVFLIETAPWWLCPYNLFPRFKMWHVLTSGRYTWSPKQFPKVEWNIQEETQPLELPHRLTFVARYNHCYQALPMINNATNDSLANCIVSWTLTYPVLLVKALRLLMQLRNGCWVTDLCPTRLHFLSLR